MQDNDEIEQDEEGWIYLPPEEVRKLQEKKTALMREMLDRLADNTSPEQK